ncbi:MAG: hypothetical protein K5694_06230, partial [Bacilli bacterium]|nr:hypothetical protein [Bacilli bacterium]
EDIENYGQLDKETDPLLTINHLLEDEEARIVNYRIVFDLSFREIAEKSGLSLGQVQASYYKAIKKLKKHYKNYKKGN